MNFWLKDDREESSSASESEQEEKLSMKMIDEKLGYSQSVDEDYQSSNVINFNAQKFEPIAYSKVYVDRYTFHSSEKETITGLREWSLKYFSEMYLYDKDTWIPRDRKVDTKGNAFYVSFSILGKIVHSSKSAKGQL